MCSQIEDRDRSSPTETVKGDPLGEAAALLWRRAESKRATGDHFAANECENCALAIERMAADTTSICPRCKVRRVQAVAWDAGGQTSYDELKYCGECLGDPAQTGSPLGTPKS